ncbi:hypothetical protein KY290_008054 [Solanum tuberosum]|uniref:Uncharacterized protein n=1 Tax=Solanum tuberosum TaxID=4113 RepID=A0ABQ7W7E0_SOLTU|nr:hypothetical protein KY290_008054 [Solanum tuberosum]
MAGGGKNKAIDNAPKKKKKKDSMISRRSTEIHIRSDSTPSLPPRDTPVHCNSRQTGSHIQLPPQIHPPSTYMHPPLEYTQQPPQAPVMMPTSGYATPHGYTHLPPESQRPTSSVSRTVNHTPTDSQPSSTSISNLGMSSRHIRGSSPGTPITNQSATYDQVHTQVGVRDIYNRLVIEPDGYTFNPDDAVRIISRTIKDLYRGSFSSWGKMPADLRRQIFLEFRKKCAWCPEHETQICANFHKKAGRLLASLFLKARKKDKKPRWILSEDWEKLVEHWETDARFKQMSEIGKKARSSTKGGSLHTSGAQSQGNVRRKLEKELRRSVTQAEAFKATHTRKKKNPGDPDVWVESRAQLTYNQYLQALEDFRQTLPEDNQGMSLSQEQAERIWLDLVGGPSRYGYAYGMPQRAFREYHSELEGLCSSHDDELRKTNLDLKQTIAELSSQVEASQVRERRRDIDFAGLKAQFDALLASGGIPPCPSDVPFPPRPSQSQPLAYG